MNINSVYEEITKSILSHNPNIFGVNKKSSILIPIIERNDSLHILYEIRSLKLKSQPGEICFPGGKVDSGEHPCESAIRETCEELNINSESIEIIGQIDSILTSFDMIIHCFIGKINLSFEEINHSTDEVEELFTIPIEELVNIDPQIYSIKTEFVLPGDFPFSQIPNGKNYNFKNNSYPVVFYKYRDYNIWGLTARMTQNFISIIRNDLNKK